MKRPKRSTYCRHCDAEFNQPEIGRTPTGKRCAMCPVCRGPIEERR